MIKRRDEDGAPTIVINIAVHVTEISWQQLAGPEKLPKKQAMWEMLIIFLIST